MSGIKGKPDVQSFINGGNRSEASLKSSTAATAKRGKMVQLPGVLLSDLKLFAIAEAAKRGCHVTETEIIETAIKKYIY